MSDDNVQRTLGSHEAQLESLDRRLESLEASAKRIEQTLNEWQGGRKTLIWLIGISAAVGAALFKLLTFISAHVK